MHQDVLQKTACTLNKIPFQSSTCMFLKRLSYSCPLVQAEINIKSYNQPSKDGRACFISYKFVFHFRNGVAFKMLILEAKVKNKTPNKK